MKIYKPSERRLPIGAEVMADGRVHFRVWAPKCQRVQVVVPPSGTNAAGRAFDLDAEKDGYFAGAFRNLRPDMLYGLRLDGRDELLPDPASRFQPQGPEGLSQVIAPRAFSWSDGNWRGVETEGQVIYEMHVGTFTREGTWQAAAAELGELSRAGMTIIEVMPVADFVGEFGWGYDGVCMFAPTRLYGRPDDFRRFVDRAHAERLGVILDVVYNHFGNVGNSIPKFSDDFRSPRYSNEWGDAINFDDEKSGPVREFFLANIRYWIDEFHLDGIRFDATQTIHDSSREHILSCLATAARDAAGSRKIFLVAENEFQDVTLIRPQAEGGYGLDAEWNDDFHHAANVRLTGHNEAYLSDFLGAPAEFVSALKSGFLYQGQVSQWQGKPRGTPTTGLPATRFVSFLQNHDQISNSGLGERIGRLTSPGRLRAMTALWLLAPQTPLFFQGQEFAASSPFVFFADNAPDQAKLVREGRAKFLGQFPSLKTPEAQAMFNDPADRASFERCKLDFHERVTNREIYALHVDLLRLRRNDAVFSRQRSDRLEGGVLGPDCLCVRFFGDDGEDRLLLSNFGRDLQVTPVAQPLFAPPEAKMWRLLWSSNHVRYGACGTPALKAKAGWRVPGESTVVLEASLCTDQDPLAEDQETESMIKKPVLQHISCRKLVEDDPKALLNREWLVTNGLGGYASGTLSGACTRRYHSLLVAAFPAPLGRRVMFNHLAEELKLEDRNIVRLDALELSDAPFDPFSAALTEFRLETGLPVWKYEVGPIQFEKRVLLPHLQNTVYINYRLAAAPAGVRLRLRPSFHFRPHDAPVSSEVAPHYAVTAVREGFEVHDEVSFPLRMCVMAERSSLVLDGGRTCNVEYRLERARGYESQGRLWNPGYFRIDLRAGQEATLIGSTENWELLRDVQPQTAWEAELERRERLLAQAVPQVREGIGEELVFAADQLIIRPMTRPADTALAHASGEEAHTVIAGYHWFTDWGRDTMICLEGLTLVTGRHNEAGNLLRTFGRYVCDGLIPNMFPEGQQQGLYHTADASLWYFHAVARYLQATNDLSTLNHLMPILSDIVDHHIRGTRFGIHVDPADGLLSQGQEGYQLTWMDAKVGDWVVTPRRGKAVEINALWYNALRLLENWHHDTGNDAAAISLGQRAEQTQASFNRRFWFAAGKYLYDIVDGEQGDDNSIRPNQILALSLDNPVLDSDRWQAVLDTVSSRLLTPFGLRSLAPGHPDYKATYDGDLRSRDAAYHQGTVWAWLIGPFIDAWLRVHPHDLPKAREFLAGFGPHLSEACMGSISEVFDAEAPYNPRGCVAQAWSVAEALRCLVKTAGAV